MKLADLYEGKPPKCVTDDPRDRNKIPVQHAALFQAMSQTMALSAMLPGEAAQENRSPEICLFRTVNNKGERVTLLMVAIPKGENGKKAFSPLGILPDDADAMFTEYVGPRDGDRLLALKGEIVLGKQPRETPAWEELGNAFAGAGKYKH